MKLRDRICLWVGDHASIRLNENKVTYGMTEREVAAFEAGRALVAGRADAEQLLARYPARAAVRYRARGLRGRRRLLRVAEANRKHLVKSALNRR